MKRVLQWTIACVLIYGLWLPAWAQPCIPINAGTPLDLTPWDDAWTQSQDSPPPPDMGCVTVTVPSGFTFDTPGSSMDFIMTHTWLGDLALRVYPPPGCGGGGALDYFSLMTRPIGDGFSNPDPADNTACCGDSSNLNASPLVFVCDGSGTDAELLGTGFAGDDVVPFEILNPNPDNALVGTVDCSVFGSSCDAAGTWTFCAADGSTLDTGAIDDAQVCVVEDLPVELVSFVARVRDNRVLLVWETASETNNAGFEVETQTGHEEDSWHAIGFVSGHGTTVEPQSYRHATEDLEPGRHVFRLKQIDTDGAFEYSSEVEATVVVPGGFVLESAYPNPFNPTTTIRFAVAEEQMVTLSLHDAQGKAVRVLFEGTAAANEMHTARINAEGLASGMYVIRLMGVGISDSKTVALMR